LGVARPLAFSSPCDYAGLGARASILDGGQPAWVREGRPVEKLPCRRRRQGKLAPLTVEPLVVDAAFVLAHRETPGYAVVDGRAASLYDGVETGGDDEHPTRTGHITGAHTVPFTRDHRRRLARALEPRARRPVHQGGREAGDTVVGYCHIGLQATAMLFAARLLGHKVLLYDGSFEDGRGTPPIRSGKIPRPRRPGRRARRGRTRILISPASAFGLVLLAAFVMVGPRSRRVGRFHQYRGWHGRRARSPAAEASPVFSRYLAGEGPWREWLLYELAASALGGYLSACLAGRWAARGGAWAGISPRGRLVAPARRRQRWGSAPSWRAGAPAARRSPGARC
jgi:hypothetical protein